EDGGVIEQETRLFDPDKGETRSMRSKEEAHDYRYFPDPDLLPLEVSRTYVDAIEDDLPELPDEKKERFTDGFGLSQDKAERLTREKALADGFEGELYRYISLIHGAGAADLIRAAYGAQALRLKADRPSEFLRNIDAAEPYHHAMVEGAENLANLVLGPLTAKANELYVDPAHHIERVKLPELVYLILN